MNNILMDKDVNMTMIRMRYCEFKCIIILVLVGIVTP